ncbi:putative post-transcriptional gene silencing PAZ-Argonaute family [Rosa chinensis]|uniref:Putative post-transcriptional gene silencing PAZ-Argonaute family n=1 Tax=Rosa chinensis TaxID=74649 RepID=A0A2P6S1Y7_ROSCH|nr:putative post-transcriptional gene silencing PAZ-Argonaute family [Rosa chinensis]
MMVAGAKNAGGDADLPPPPPTIPSNLKPELLAPPKYSIMTRPCRTGTTGRGITLLANHFKVSVNNPDAVFYQYSVHMTYEDNNPVLPGMGIGRKLMDRLYHTYSMEFDGNKFAYDGEKSLYTFGPLPLHKLNYTVVLEESVSRPHVTEKRMKLSIQSKTFNVEISYAAKIPLKPIALALKGADADDGQDALRVLDIVLRQQAANRGCLLVRQSFFQDDSRCITAVGGTGLSTVRGFHSSFRPTQGGLTLNMGTKFCCLFVISVVAYTCRHLSLFLLWLLADVSTTLILTPGPVIDFLKANQGVQHPRNIDWARAKRMLKNLRIKTRHHNMEFKITGLSQNPCREQYDDGTTVEQTVDITVYEYFTKHRGIELTYSANFPCLDVGKPKRPNYVPLELCSLVSLQRYKKALSSKQRASIVGSSRQRPQERINSVTNAVRNYGYNDDPVLAACGISIEKQLTQIEGRVLEAPKLKVGNSSDCMPSDGRWNFNGKTFLNPKHIDKWIVVNFSLENCDTSRISRQLYDIGRKKGIRIEYPITLIEEQPQLKKQSPIERVKKMFEQIKVKHPTEPPNFILCVLPERKTSDIYGPWKKECLVDYGIVTQCISPPMKKNNRERELSEQYLTNLGGINSLLATEHSGVVSLIKDTPTMILGMDVSHGPPGRSDIPSVAAVVGSLQWPLISQYRAAVRTQKVRKEMIDSLYKPLESGEDDGIMRELLKEFYKTSKCKPTQIIIFRDGVSESQFNQVLNEELDQIMKAYKHHQKVDELPKFTVIVAQKNHNTKLFQAGSPQYNVPPGTVVDTNIVHPRNYDFYMCAHKGSIGTSRPVHYHVLLDEIGFSANELQNLIHSLSYVYQRSTTAVSIVAPICYAHLAAAQVMQFMKFEDLSATSSSGRVSVTTSESIPVPELPRLHEKVRSSMFFC